MFDAHRHMSYALYRESGDEHGHLYGSLFSKHADFSRPTRILEWGSGTARILRHLRAHLPGGEVQLEGCDYNAEMVEWCRRNVSGIEFRRNGLKPPLPYEEARFDIVFCRSVLTHLSIANADAHGWRNCAGCSNPAGCCRSPRRATRA
jgi:SAM-dependent methyltransferase